MYNNGFAFGQQPMQYSGPPPPLQGYQQPGFQQPTYGQPPQQFQQQAQQPTFPAQGPSSFANPALATATDPNAFAQMFKGHLAALTFNSKPIITNLTVIAHEHSARMANVVAQCLDEHILSVSWWHHESA